jgi:hypothetical protein
MRSAALFFVVFAAPIAFADCPPDCVAGGGPAATDCFVAFSGIPSTSVTCTDGDASCDTDGAADGACTLALQVCAAVAGLGSCTPAPLASPPAVKPANDPVAQQLSAALQGLAQGCRPVSLHLPLKVSLAGIKPGKSKLTVSATSGGKTDRDKLRLTCAPSRTAPSFTQEVQPIFTSRCATSACHDASFRGGNQVLAAGMAYADTVGVKSSEIPNLFRVKPGSLKSSFLARKILGQGVPPGRGGAMMPQGCPGIPPTSGCLTSSELFTILSWIQNGAPND